MICWPPHSTIDRNLTFLYVFLLFKKNLKNFSCFVSQWRQWPGEWVSGFFHLLIPLSILLSSLFSYGGFLAGPCRHGFCFPVSSWSCWLCFLLCIFSSALLLRWILVSYCNISFFIFLLYPYLPFYISLALQFYFHHCLKKFVKLLAFWVFGNRIAF